MATDNLQVHTQPVVYATDLSAAEQILPAIIRSTQVVTVALAIPPDLPQVMTVEALVAHVLSAEAPVALGHLAAVLAADTLQVEAADTLAEVEGKRITRI